MKSRAETGREPSCSVSRATMMRCAISLAGSGKPAAHFKFSSRLILSILANGLLPKCRSTPNSSFTWSSSPSASSPPPFSAAVLAASSRSIRSLSTSSPSHWDPAPAGSKYFQNMWLLHVCALYLTLNASVSCELKKLVSTSLVESCELELLGNSEPS